MAEPSLDSCPSTRSLKVTPLPLDPITGALDFEEFSMLGSDGDIQPSNAGDYCDTFRHYLADTYECSALNFVGPFLIIEYPDDIPLPPEDQRPTTIAGAITIWISEGDGPINPFPGDHASGDEIMIEKRVVDLMEYLHIPPDEAITYLFYHVFPDCETISLLWDTLIIELPKTDVHEYVERLQTLPKRIRGAGCVLQYHNGPLQIRPDDVAVLRIWKGSWKRPTR